MTEGPLTGIRVLEFSLIVAAPFCGVLLSDLGADVVKVEPLGGEAHRNFGAVVPNEGKRFQSLNRGKRGICLDLSRTEGRELAQQLARDADVVTVNYAQGVAERLGIGYETLRTSNPGLVYCQMTGFGSHGPMANRVATDIVAAAHSGLLIGNGNFDDEDELVQMRPPVVDYMTGLAAAMAICAALYHRRESGEGQRIDTSLLQTAMALQDVLVMREPVSDASLRDEFVRDLQVMRARGTPLSEQVLERERYRTAGTGSPRLYYSTYRARDGEIALGALTKATRASARRVLGLHDEDSDSVAFDPADPENELRVARWKDRIRETMRTKTVAEWIAEFEAAKVPVSVVQFPEELSDDPQVAALGIMADLVHALTGPQRVVGPIVNMSSTPARARRAAPPLGGHTDEVLLEAGVDSGKIASLRAGSVIA